MGERRCDLILFCNQRSEEIRVIGQRCVTCTAFDHFSGRSRLADAEIEMFGKQTGLLFPRARTSQKRRYEAATKDVGRLMRLFGSTIGTLRVAREDGLDPWAALETGVGWERLMGVADEVSAIADLVRDEPLVRASDKYMTLRQYAPAFLDAFRFKAAGSRDGVLAAVKLVRELNATGKREVPTDAPMPFPKSWKTAITEGGSIDRRRYETATVAMVRERLGSGDLCDHLWFDSYLLPRPDAAPIVANLPFDTNVDRYLNGRAKLLDWRLCRFGNALRRGTLDGVELKGNELRVAPRSRQRHRPRPTSSMHSSTGSCQKSASPSFWPR